MYWTRIARILTQVIGTNVPVVESGQISSYTGVLVATTVRPQVLITLGLGRTETQEQVAWG